MHVENSKVQRHTCRFNGVWYMYMNMCVATYLFMIFVMCSAAGGGPFFFDASNLALALSCAYVSMAVCMYVYMYVCMYVWPWPCLAPMYA